MCGLVSGMTLGFGWGPFSFGGRMTFLAGLITGIAIAAFAVMAFAYSFARKWAE